MNFRYLYYYYLAFISLKEFSGYFWLTKITLLIHFIIVSTYYLHLLLFLS